MTIMGTKSEIEKLKQKCEKNHDCKNCILSDFCFQGKSLVYNFTSSYSNNGITYTTNTSSSISNYYIYNDNYTYTKNMINESEIYELEPLLYEVSSAILICSKEEIKRKEE